MSLQASRSPLEVKPAWRAHKAGGVPNRPTLMPFLARRAYWKNLGGRGRLESKKSRG